MQASSTYDEADQSSWLVTCGTTKCASGVLNELINWSNTTVGSATTCPRFAKFANICRCGSEPFVTLHLKCHHTTVAT